MELVYADIELINADDVAFAKKNITGEEEIKKVSLNMLVDSGAYIPMEEMDVLMHPLRQELVINPEHPNYAVLKMK